MKSEFVADVLNKTVYTLVTNCSKADGVRDYFHIGVIGYGGAGVTAGLGGRSPGELVPIAAVANRRCGSRSGYGRSTTAPAGSSSRRPNSPSGSSPRTRAARRCERP